MGEQSHGRNFLGEGSVGPTEPDVARVAALQDRVVRNLEITQCYAELSAAMRARVGTASWCTFATWASRQAGSTVRGEDLLDRFRRRLGVPVQWVSPWMSMSRWLLRRGVFDSRTRLGRAVALVHTPFDAFERASDAVAAGNLKVFEEIAREFARFIATVPVDAPPDSAEFRAFTDRFQPGSPPGGQDYLIAAFTHYQQQRHEPDPAARAALTLLGNLEIGLHEQTRLQPEILAGVDAPVTTAADLGARVLHVLIPGSRDWPRLLHRPAAATIGWIAKALHRVAVKITREVVTDAMMVLQLPERVLALGHDLDAPVPAILAANAHPGLGAFVKAYDSCAPGAFTCGAEDWCELPERMHYIVHLFRAFADDPSLFSPPFTAAQVACFRAGMVPDGEL